MFLELLGMLHSISSDSRDWCCNSFWKTTAKVIDIKSAGLSERHRRIGHPDHVDCESKERGVTWHVTTTWGISVSSVDSTKDKTQIILFRRKLTCFPWNPTASWRRWEGKPRRGWSRCYWFMMMIRRMVRRMTVRVRRRRIGSIKVLSFEFHDLRLLNVSIDCRFCSLSWRWRTRRHYWIVLLESHWDWCVMIIWYFQIQEGKDLYSSDIRCRNEGRYTGTLSFERLPSLLSKSGNEQGRQVKLLQRKQVVMLDKPTNSSKIFTQDIPCQQQVLRKHVKLVNERDACSRKKLGICTEGNDKISIFVRQNQESRGSSLQHRLSLSLLNLWREMRMKMREFWEEKKI